MNRITKKLQAAGLPLELIRGDGYCYFVFDEDGKWETLSVYVARISDLPADRWIQEGREFVQRMRSKE